MDLSVVIASIDARRSLDECLRRLRASCAGLRAELIVVDASGDETVARAAVGDDVTLIARDRGTLAPELWAAGLRHASGRVVAFTTAHCLAAPEWARALLAALENGATGAGGPLLPAPRTRPLDWAVFYLRYSAFMPSTLGSGRIAGEIAGDNAAYWRDALERYRDRLEHGFWEVDVHAWIHADGGWLAAVPAALMEFGPSFSFATIARHRFAHGRHFGAGRTAGGRSVWGQVLAAPLVPLVLASRALSRLHGMADGARFAAALPWWLALASCWAVGEAWGALHGASKS